MSRVFAVVRPHERRDTWAAFSTLFGFIASHSMLETARDALFLSKLPASRLPWVYLVIVVASVGVARAQSSLSRLVAGRAALTAWTLVASLVTFSFWILAPALGESGLYGLYIWSGVLTSLVLVHFWTLLGGMFTVTQAKRVYGVIGAGSVLGAITGSGAASALARVMPAGHLLLVSAGGFLVTAALPLLLRADAGAAATSKDASSATDGGLLENARYVARKPYVRAVAGVVIISTVGLTVADYLFKSQVALHIPKDQLGAYFGTVYLILNILSLVAQLSVVQWLLRRFDISVALAVLPVLLLLGASGMLVGGGLAAALLMKGADGTLRYSLHRTSTELLFVPLGDRARRRMKSFIDVLGQRFGQALASVGILASVALGAPPRFLAAALLVVAGCWVVVAIRLRRHYFDVFRRHLREGRLEHLDDFPELDVASLETLIAALDSSNDAEVIAALDILERENKAHLVPALILYHPSEAVVLRSLTLFGRAGKKGVAPVVDRLFEHPSARVRSAAIAARSVLAPDAKLLNLRLSLEESAEVRATIVMQLIALGEIIGAEADERVAALLRSGSPEARIALCSAIALRDTQHFDQVLVELSRAEEPEVRRAAGQAMAQRKAEAFPAALLRLLADERTRPTAHAALVSHGEEGLAALEGALLDASLPQAVRWEVPRALGLFDAQRAASTLLRHLGREADGMVRYRSIRALEILVVRNPHLKLDRDALTSEIEATVSRCYRYLDRRLTLLRGAAVEPSRATPGHALLVNMLRDKEENALSRLFRLLGLQYPTEDFAQIRRGFDSARKDARVSSVELIGHLLESPLREAVLGLLDDTPDAERLAAADRFHAPLDLEYEALLEGMLESSSESVQDLTVYHIGELRLAGLRGCIERLPNQDKSRADVNLTLELLAPAPAAAPVPEAAPC